MPGRPSAAARPCQMREAWWVCSVSDIALRREPRLSCNGSLLVAMVIARWWTGSRQHPHAAEGSQSTNRNEPAPVLCALAAQRATAPAPLRRWAFTSALRASVVDGLRAAPHVALPFDAILRSTAVPRDRFCRPPWRSLHGFDKPCAQVLRSRSRRRSMCCRATSGGTTSRGGSGGGASRRRWCWRCRAGLLGPRIELASHGALDDAEQVPGGVADAMLAAPCDPFVQHGLPQGSVHLLQRHPGSGLLFRLQFREALPLQVAQRTRLRGSTYFIYTTTTYCTGPASIPKSAVWRGFRPCFGLRRGAPFRRRLAGPSSNRGSHPPVDNFRRR